MLQLLYNVIYFDFLRKVWDVCRSYITIWKHSFWSLSSTILTVSKSLLRFSFSLFLFKTYFKPCFFKLTSRCHLKEISDFVHFFQKFVLCLCFIWLSFIDFLLRNLCEIRDNMVCSTVKCWLFIHFFIIFFMFFFFFSIDYFHFFHISFL